VLKHKGVKETVASNPECSSKMAVHWVTKTIRQMIRRKALEWQETKVGNCEVTPQALWPVVKSLVERGGPKAPTAVRGPLGITYHLNEKANVIAECLENQLASVDDTPLGEVRPCKYIN
jgi:hypothetical protein